MNELLSISRAVALIPERGSRSDGSSGLPEIIADREAWQAAAPSLSGTTLFVDALLGTGLAKPLEGYLLEVVRDINAGHPAARVLAVDLPTGISADSGELIGEHLRADF